MEPGRAWEEEDKTKAAMDPSREEGAEGEQAGLEASVAQKPTTTPMPTIPGTEQQIAQHESQERPHGMDERVNKTEDGEEVSPGADEDALKTPRLQDSTSAHTTPTLIESAIMQPTGERQGLTIPPGTSALETGDYFSPLPPATSDVTDLGNYATSFGVSSNSGSPRVCDAPLSPPIPSQHGDTLRDIAAGSSIESLHSPESTRPTSVPNLQTAALQRRRDVQDYPQYPNQSFAALQKNPPHPHPLRTRTSNPLHNLSYSSTNPNSATMGPHLPSGAKTVGNTPAQSPGLFSPASSKRSTNESEDGGYQTPMLHPTHLQAPKE